MGLYPGGGISKIISLLANRRYLGVLITEGSSNVAFYSNAHQSSLRSYKLPTKKLITLSSAHNFVKTQTDSIPNMNNSVSIADLKPIHQITDVLLVTPFHANIVKCLKAKTFPAKLYGKLIASLSTGSQERKERREMGMRKPVNKVLKLPFSSLVMNLSLICQQQVVIFA